MVLLEDLRKKRKRYDIEADRHKKKRDELNTESRRWIEQRDKLNAKARDLIEKARLHRVTRDELNDKVKQTKKDRDEWNKRVGELREEIGKLKRKKLSKNGVSIERLRRELKMLEFKQMTSVLSVDKERELIEILSKLQSEIEEMEKTLEQDEEMKRMIKELQDVKEKAEECHRLVEGMAENAQNEHADMMEAYDDGDRVRKEADECQERFIKSKTLADEEHKKHIEFIRMVYDFDKIISGLNAKERRARKEEEDTLARKEAEDVYERFKRGEKLSTEDILALQKSGYL
jgi:uncharacterized coiled-coil DUF342 family protein